MPAVFAITADYFPRHQRGRALAIVTTGIALGSASASLVSGFILTRAETLATIDWPLIGRVRSWSLVFIVCGLLGLAAAAILLTVNDKRKDAKSRDMGTLRRNRLMPFVVQNWRAMVAIMASYLFVIFIQYAHATWLSTLFVRRLEVTPAESAYIYGIALIIFATFSTIFGGILSDVYFKTKKAGRFALIPMAGGAVCVAILLETAVPSMPIMITGLCLMIVAGGIISTSVYAALQDIAPEGLRSQMLALYGLAAGLIGLGLGPPAVGLATDHIFGNPNEIYRAMMLVMLPASLAAVVTGLLGRSSFHKMWSTNIQNQANS